MHDSYSDITMSRRKPGYMQVVSMVLTKGREFESSARSFVGHVLAWRNWRPYASWYSGLRSAVRFPR